jgi:hypothetical protein
MAALIDLRRCGPAKPISNLEVSSISSFNGERIPTNLGNRFGGKISDIY